MPYSGYTLQPSKLPSVFVLHYSLFISDMPPAVTRPDYRAVYRDPDSYLDFIEGRHDNDFEGQHYERKQVGRNDGATRVSKSQFNDFVSKVAKTMSGFANASGGLLIVGVSSNGEVLGIDHLSDSQKGDLLALQSLKGAQIHGTVHTIRTVDQTRQIALLMVESHDRTYCCRIRDEAAWIRKGTNTCPLRGEELEHLKRSRRIVDFELMPACPFTVSDIDEATIDEFIKCKHYTMGQSAEDVLYEVGAIQRDEAKGYYEWTYAGMLFFASNPRRVVPHAYIRLLRFDCSIEDADERPTPDFEKDVDGNVARQIRTFRTFLKESAFFKVFHVRSESGGFESEPEFPHVAVDEAVVNAIVHRDYGIRQPIVCEKYIDAFVVQSPGQIRQPTAVPNSFDLGEFSLRSWLRNQTLMDWLRVLKNTEGAPFVKAIGEGTRAMRDEMERLQLPAPKYHNLPLVTSVIMVNEFERRAARPTGLASVSLAETEEFTNLYLLDGFNEGGIQDDVGDSRRVFFAALCDKLRSKGWVIDVFRKGRVITHPLGSRLAIPKALSHIVCLIPAYSLSMRTYFHRSYLAIDFKVRVQSMLTAKEASTRFGTSGILGLSAYAWVAGKTEIGQIAGVRGDNMVLIRTGNGELVPLLMTDVFPKLRREQMQGLVANAAPEIDFAARIKAASISFAGGGAHARAAKIATTVSRISRDVFPIMAGIRNVTLADDPVHLHTSGDGKRALRIAQLPEPRVEFRQRRFTADVRSGIVEFGAYDDSPRDLKIVAIAEPGFEELMRRLVKRMTVGSFRYKGSERTFATRFTLSEVITATSRRAEVECKRLIETNSRFRDSDELDTLFLVHTPEGSYRNDDVSAPYFLAKRVLLEAGLPSQMVDSSTLRNPDYKDLNLALNIVAKTGAAPWVLPDSIPDADFFIGLSYSKRGEEGMDRGVIGFANVFNRYGRWEFYSGGTRPVPYKERARYYEELVASTLDKLDLADSPTVYFHYSAKFGRADRDAILAGARSIRPRGNYVFVWINTHHPVRMFDRRKETDGSVARGRFVVCSGNQLVLSTTGYNQYRKGIGTPRSLEINVYNNDNNVGLLQSIDHRVIAQQVLCLTKLNWASSDALCGEPITTKYAKKIAYLMTAFQKQDRKPFVLGPRLERTPWFI